MRNKVIFIISIFVFLYSCKQDEPQISIEESKIFFILGDVKINGEKAKLNQQLANNDRITTGPKSRAEIILGTHSAVQVRENANIRVINENNNWEVKTNQGAVLSIVQRGRKYKVNGPSAVAAVRGTIFYVNTMEDGSQYICTCNGVIDIEYQQNIKTVSAAHHQPYLVSTKTEMEQDMMKGHTDEEIFEFMFSLNQALKK